MYPKDPHDVKWFSAPDTADEAKALYGRLSLRFHPGRGGDAAVMTAINAQYASCLQSMTGRTFVGPDGNARTYRYDADRERSVVQTLDHLLALRMVEVHVRLVGFHIWVKGRTGHHTGRLKELGLRWHDERQCWYWNPQDMPRLAEPCGYGRFSNEHAPNRPTA